jgi:hypothetical protein
VPSPFSAVALAIALFYLVDGEFLPTRLAAPRSAGPAGAGPRVAREAGRQKLHMNQMNREIAWRVTVDGAGIWGGTGGNVWDYWNGLFIG